MKMQRIAFLLTLINLAIMTFLLVPFRPARAQQPVQNPSPVLRGRALEIVDSLGKIRASITIEPPVVVDGRRYPQTVLLRLIDDRQKPLVKLGVTGHGSGFSLSDEFDGGILIHARDTGSYVKITNKGKERILAP